MTPDEFFRASYWNLNQALDAQDRANDDVELALMERHLAVFIHVSTRIKCPRCGSPAGAYCAIYLDTYRGVCAFEPTAPTEDFFSSRYRLFSLGLCPERTASTIV